MRVCGKWRKVSDGHGDFREKIDFTAVGDMTVTVEQDGVFGVCRLWWHDVERLGQFKAMSLALTTALRAVRSGLVAVSPHADDTACDETVYATGWRP